MAKSTRKTPVFNLLPRSERNAITENALRAKYKKSNGTARGFKASMEDATSRPNVWWTKRGASKVYWRVA